MAAGFFRGAIAAFGRNDALFDARKQLQTYVSRQH